MNNTYTVTYTVGDEELAVNIRATSRASARAFFVEKFEFDDILSIKEVRA